MAMGRATRDIIDANYERYVALVVCRLRRITAKDWDGDDSPMRTLWDHWKREVQEEHSFFHGLIEDMVEDVARQEVDRMPQDEGTLLTLATHPFEDDEPDELTFDRDAVAKELIGRISFRALDEPHRGEVQRLLDDQARDRFDRDDEPYRQSVRRFLRQHG